MGEYQVCPICDRGNLKRLKQHVQGTHKIEWGNFIDEYGYYDTCTKDHSDKMREVGLRYTSDQRSESLRNRWENNVNGFRDRVTESTYRQWEDPEFIKLMKDTGRDTMNNLWNQEWFREMKSETSSYILKSLWESTERKYGPNKDMTYREMMDNYRSQWNESEECYQNIMNLNTRWSDPSRIEEVRNQANKNNRGTMTDYTKNSGEVVRLRSLLEFSIAYRIEELGYEFDYESLSIEYYDTELDKYRRYIPDFLVDGVIYEVKPQFKWMDQNTIDKVTSAELESYTIHLISSEKDLDNYLII